MKTPQSWPVEVRQGSVVVRIYRVENRKGDKTYVEFRVSHYGRDGKRHLKAFSDYAKAHQHASTVGAAMGGGDASSLILAGAESGTYIRARASLDPLKIDLDVAAAEYARATTQLGGIPLAEAVGFYLKNCAALKQATVAEVVDELVENRRTPPGTRKAASAKYLKDLSGRLNRFASFAQVPIASVGPEEVRLFLSGIEGGPRTRHNYFRLLGTMFAFAKAKRYYPTSLDPFGDDLRQEFDYDDDSEIEIWTPGELRRLLDATRPEMIPLMAIGAFAGLRTAEIERLDWADIKPGHIEITKGKAKTRSRRLVPISDNLQSWLAPHRRESGSVCPFAHTSKQLLAIGAAAGIPWRHNALRHSFVSYRMGAAGNENLVAAEAGNSPSMIHANYRELVTAADAAAWFGILPPEAATNVIPLQSAAG